MRSFKFQVSSFKFRAVSALLMAALLTVTLSSSGCGASSLAKNADRVGRALTQAQPIFQSLIDGGVIPSSRGAQIIARLAEGAADAQVLADAFRSGNTSDAVDTAAKLINVFETLISQDTQLISNPAQRTTVLAILAAADIALHVIADNLVKTAQANARLSDSAMAWAPAQTKKSAEVIRQFAKKPQLRCRSSVTGRFVPMKQCKEQPDTTEVVRIVKKKAVSKTP